MASPVEVKIGGDGAPFSRTSSYILLSFSLPSLQKKLSSDGVHTIAALKGADDYTVLKDGFAPVIKEINDLLQDKYKHNTILNIISNCLPLLLDLLK